MDKVAKPTVSIIVPIYNTSKYLVRCLDSIKNQTLEHIEVILVNDGSTDESQQICETYISEYNLNWKLYSKKNGGLSSTRHFGWKKSSGEYIVFVDSDDDIESEYCNMLYESAKSSGSDMSICGYRQIENISRKVSRKEYIPDINGDFIEDIQEEYSKRLIIPYEDGQLIPGFLWMRMMKRNIIKDELFINENLVFSEDQIFDLEYSTLIRRIAVVKKPLYNYYINPGSLTLKYRPKMLEMTKNLTNYFQKYLTDNKLLDENSEDEIHKIRIDGIISAIINSLRFGKISLAFKLSSHIQNYSEGYNSFKQLNSKSKLSRRQKTWWYLIKLNLLIIPQIYYKFRYFS